MLAEIERRIAGRFDSGQSVLVVVKDNRAARLPSVAAAIDALGVGLGFHMIRVPTSNIEKHFEAVDGSARGAIMLVILQDSPDQRTARFLKHIADDFRRNRVGLVLPDGSVLTRQLPIQCACIVTLQDVLAQWRDGYLAIADYYSVVEV